MQKTELCMLQLSAFSPSIINYVAPKKFPNLLSNNGHAIHKDQIFDDEIDHKCCVKNLLRFLSRNFVLLDF